MKHMEKPIKRSSTLSNSKSYQQLVGGIAQLLETARRQAARAVNTILTATYWEIGRKIVEFEQRGKRRAEYGKQLLTRLARDLTAELGHGFSERNLEQMRLFYLEWPIPQTLSAKSETLSRKSESPIRRSSASVQLEILAEAFPLPWSHYVRVLSVKNLQAPAFYEAEALRGGWSVRQLDRQISSLFYERTALSRNKAAMLTKGAKARPEDRVGAEEEIKDPYVLEFLNLKDEYSESSLEEALILHLENFLLELGGDFTYMGRQKRLRVGDQWYRVDLLFFHRKLHCLIVIDLKVGSFSHADAGQMHLYLNYAREHWTHPDENPPVGLILCTEKDSAVAKYALEDYATKSWPPNTG